MAIGRLEATAEVDGDTIGAAAAVFFFSLYLKKALTTDRV
jgi:hypothetical protein